jgi:acetyl-CoA carboxylase carboxyltransferase component
MLQLIVKTKKETLRSLMEKEDPRIAELREKRAKALKGGGQSRIDRQHAKGKLTARERLDLLLDQGSFTELEAFTKGQDDDPDGEIYGDGVVTGYGTVNGRTV